MSKNIQVFGLFHRNLEQQSARARNSAFVQICNLLLIIFDPPKHLVVSFHVVQFVSQNSHPLSKYDRSGPPAGNLGLACRAILTTEILM